MKIDMLEVKKGRLMEIDKQLRKAYRFRKLSKINQNGMIIPLWEEKKKLLIEIKDSESKRGVINE